MPDAFRPRNPEFAAAVRSSFAKHGFLRTIGALHGALITAIVDVACGYAALSLMPPKCLRR